MGHIDLHQKLNNLLTAKMPFVEEAHVVYLLVEVRKMLDRNGDSSYPLLRFYCDWSVHTEKDRITPGIKTIMVDVFKNRAPTVRDGIATYSNTALADFSQMFQLKAEIRDFLNKYKLPISLIDDSNWVQFIFRLVNILADQPINSPCRGIESFLFRPSPFGAVLGQIKYEKGTFHPVEFEFATAY